MENLPDGGYIVHVEPVAFIPVAIIAGIGVVMTSVFIAVNIKYRGYKLLKMTSPNLNLVMLCGALLLCVSTVLFGSTAWLPESPHQELLDIVWQINHAGIWTASVGFTLFFAPLATKTWRVHRIFTDAAVKGRVIKDDRLLCIVALFVIFDFGYLALWFGIDPPKCYVIPTSQLPGFFPVSPVNDVSEELPTSSTVMTSLEHGFTCASKYTPLWIIILMSYKGALLYYILYVAWATRYVTLPSMKDAGGLIISVFATLTSFCIATPLVTSLQRWPNPQYIVMSSAIFVPLFTVMFLHFVPKLILIRRHSKDEVLTRSFSQYTTPKQPEFSEDEIRDLAIQNASLRKEMAEV
uniref:gamma-aminobutyric acid type B receptor subunit 2-like n=1 Tax=Styela clava TaxID=7725 RepID=UPI001939A6B7|nr:gamma-aminobutyric acid type B receptor subunit 2-like [Styela clava]